MINKGAARNAPTGPQSQVQNTSDRKTSSGLSVNLRPTALGVTISPSSVAQAR